jgi:GNAT superfamily N-acetyltransferase
MEWLLGSSKETDSKRKSGSEGKTPVDTKKSKSNVGHVKNANYSIKWEFEQNLGSGRDGHTLDHYVHNYVGTLIQTIDRTMGCHFDESEDDEEGKESIQKCVAGTISCWKIKNHNIGNTNLHIVEVLDPISEDLMQVGMLIATLAGDFDTSDLSFNPNRAIYSMFNAAIAQGAMPKEITPNDCGNGFEISGGDIVYIDKLIVHKEFRGLGLGHFMVDSAINVINSHDSLTLIRPFPLQYENERFQNAERPQDYPPVGDINADTSKIRNYYKKLGFKALGPDYMGLWNGYHCPHVLKVSPKLNELLNHYPI